MVFASFCGLGIVINVVGVTIIVDTGVADVAVVFVLFPVCYISLWDMLFLLSSWLLLLLL